MSAWLNHEINVDRSELTVTVEHNHDNGTVHVRVASPFGYVSATGPTTERAYAEACAAALAQARTERTRYLDLLIDLDDLRSGQRDVRRILDARRQERNAGTEQR